MELTGRGRDRADRLKRRLVRWTSWGVGAALLLAIVADLQAQATPAGTVISSAAQATFQDPAGQSFTVFSNTATVVVGQVAGVDVAPPRVSTGDPGRTIVFPHTLQNIGNGTDSFAVSTQSQTGWPVTVFRDANANGSLDPGDPPVGEPDFSHGRRDCVAAGSGERPRGWPPYAASPIRSR